MCVYRIASTIGLILFFFVGWVLVRLLDKKFFILENKVGLNAGVVFLFFAVTPLFHSIIYGEELTVTYKHVTLAGEMAFVPVGLCLFMGILLVLDAVRFTPIRFAAFRNMSHKILSNTITKFLGIGVVSAVALTLAFLPVIRHNCGKELISGVATIQIICSTK